MLTTFSQTYREVCRGQKWGPEHHGHSEVRQVPAGEPYARGQVTTESQAGASSWDSSIARGGALCVLRPGPAGPQHELVDRMRAKPTGLET